MQLVRNPWDLWRVGELGMGYQFARRVDDRGSSSDSFMLVINSVVAVSRSEIATANVGPELDPLFRRIDKILELGKLEGSMSERLWAQSELEGYTSGEYEIEDNPQKFLEFLGTSNSFSAQRYTLEPLHQSPPFSGTSRLDDVMYRYTILRNDPRIGANGGLAAGTYATTASDAAFVVSGFGAVGRYALPALAPRCYKFRIVPPSGAPIKVGACQPSFGQAGGGVEVEFTAALPAGSASFDGSIPEF
jgi:hypothetical protein